MSQHYSDPSRADDAHALPDVEVFQLTAEEVAGMDDELIHEYLRKHEFRLGAMNSRTRDAMLAAMIEDNGIKGGWFYWFCFPGCMPEGSAMGPYKTHGEALAAAREDAGY
jgi:hypothetical protein